MSFTSKIGIRPKSKARERRSSSKKVFAALFYQTLALCLISLAFSGSLNAATIFTNPITNTNPSASNPFSDGQTVDANATATGIGRGTGVAANAGGDRYNATAWNLAGLDTTDYFTWTVTANAGYELNLGSFAYTGQRSGTGPNSFAFRSSVDGFASNIGTPTATGTMIDLSAAAYQGLTSPVEFRLYGWGGTSAAGTYSVNDFTFSGSVDAIAVPEPALGVLVLSTLLLPIVGRSRFLR